jgi:hypothetical protein
MKSLRSMTIPVLAGVAGLAMAAPGPAQAAGGDDWESALTIYGWLPTMGGEVTVPLRETQDVSFKMDPGDVLDALEFTFQGAFQVQKGRWGLGTDLIYLDLSGTEKNKRSFELGDEQIPGEAQLKVNASLSGWIWTTGVTYQVIEDAAYPMQVVGGVRMLDLSVETKLSFSGDISGVPLPGRTARGKTSNTWWDAVVGVKGRFDPGQEKAWFVPYYADIGTGDSDLTWQALLGIGYAFDWGDVLAVWRYLDYEMPHGDDLNNLYSSGAAIGVTFRF